MTILETPNDTPPKDDWLSRPLALYLTLDWEKVAYLLLIVLGIISRFWALGDRVVSHDESLHTQYSYQFYDGQGFSHTPLMHGPFLFHATALVYWLFGHNDYTARITVALLGIFLIVSPYFLRDWVGRKGALFASFVLLISPYVWYYSRYIRHDVPSIAWALILVIATWFYFRDGRERSLWWFAAGLALLFSTKEVSFIYVAIFGSFTVFRLLNRVAYTPWFKNSWKQLRMPVIVIGVGLLVLGAGLVAKSGLEGADTAVSSEMSSPDAFAADPSVEIPHSAANDNNTAVTIARWVQILGIIVASGGLFLAAKNLRPQLEKYPEFDLIILYSTLLLPMTAPLLITIVGWDPLDYSLTQCFVPGQETMSGFSLFFARLFSGACWQMFFTAGIVRSALIAVPMLGVSVAVGLWWHTRRWLISAAIFFTIYIVLYTSVFTNPNGIATGTIGSLGYWLVQQEVQRGSQPWFYYAVVMPLYEFMPVFFSLAAIWVWSVRERINHFVGYWAVVLGAGSVVASWVHWVYNRNYTLPGNDPSFAPALVTTVVLFALAVLGYFLLSRKFLAGRGTPQNSFGDILRTERLVDFFPFLMWWFAMTVLAYSYAGEKMPWLSIHFVIPMAFMVGYFFQQILENVSAREFFQRDNLLYLLLTTLTLVGGSFLFRSLWRGEVRFGSPLRADLQGTYHFIGMVLLTAVLIGFLIWLGDKVSRGARRRGWALSIFILLSLLTVRAGYMANFPNGDYATEHLVYAHGAPATKSQVLAQLETISMRLYGDKSIKVVYDNASSWPYTWYLRDYPNRQYVGENITPSVTDAPVLIIGNDNWGKVDPFAQNQYTAQTFTYLWWPMEDYRQISWDALLGDPNSPDGIRKGLGNPSVRQALWDIFIHRDYTQYGLVHNKSFDLGQWPLRDEVRIYIRNDVAGLLWDYGVAATAVSETVTNPYAEGDLQLTVGNIIGQGELIMPRNAAVGPDGLLYVADSGNHRIVVFDGTETVLSFGGFGAGEGQLNEPWGIAVDDEFVYVADTWNHRVQKFTLTGEFVRGFGVSGVAQTAQENPGFFFGPRDLALLNDNQIAVTDTGNHRIQIFDRDGNFVLATGGVGTVSGQFYEPVGLATNPTNAPGALFVADTWNQRIQELNSEISFLPVNEWPVSAWPSQSIDNKPYMALDNADRLYVTDPEGYRVLIFGRDGTYIGRFGQFGQDAAGFDRPTGITLDSEGNVYVVDTGNGRVVQYIAPFGPTSLSDPLAVEEAEADDAEAETEETLEDDGSASETESEPEAPEGEGGAEEETQP